MKSQKENIRVALENGHRITSLDALQWFGYPNEDTDEGQEVLRLLLNEEETCVRCRR